jgi:hypothetical protein
MNKIFKEYNEFKDSSNDVGLQLADVVANTFRRLVKGNLKFEGWKGMGRLVISKKNGSINLVALHELSSSNTVTVPYGEKIQYLNQTARSMWPE